MHRYWIRCDGVPRNIGWAGPAYIGSQRLSCCCVGWSYSVDERMSCALFAKQTFSSAVRYLAKSEV